MSRRKRQNRSGNPWILGFVASSLLAIVATASADPSRQILVKFKAEGSRALTECAETLHRDGRSFRDATRDDSPSLDDLNRELGVRRIRALFRRPNGRPLAEQRRRLQAPLMRLRASMPATSAGVPEAATDLSHVYTVDLAHGISTEKAAARFGADPHVEYAQPNYAVQAQFIPNDPYFSSTGSWGQESADLWGLLLLQMEDAWDLSRGTGVVVAVADTGLDYEHPDIAANVWINDGEDLDHNGEVDDSDFNGLDDDDNGYIDDLRGFDWAAAATAESDGTHGRPNDIPDSDPFDDHGHGTHVSGTIAAVANNALGIVGVAPEAKLMALKGLDGNGSGVISSLANAIVYAARNGARAINNSWSCSTPCPTNPVAEDAVRFAHAAGAVVVFSAGNKSADIVEYSPQNMRETISVAASTPDDERADFSSTGLVLDVAAPGGLNPSASAPLQKQNVLSLLSSGAPPQFHGQGALIVGDIYSRLAGTSMSAPHVTGIVALLLSLYPDLDYEDVRAILRASADDIDAPGHDALTGAGRVNAYRALSEAEAPHPSAVISAPPVGSVLNPLERDVEIRGTAAGETFESYQLFWGRSRSPGRWVAITDPVTTPVVSGLLGVWPTAERANGSHVIRMVVTGSDGDAVEEFVTLSFERNPGRRISTPGPDANAPSISGDYVVWHSARRAADQPAPLRPVDDLNLFASHWHEESEIALMTAPGDQHDASLSGRLVSWIDERWGEHGAAVACRPKFPDDQPSTARLSRLEGTCNERRLTLTAEQPGATLVSDDWVAWSARTPESSFNLYACPWADNGQSCESPIAFTSDSEVWYGFDFDAGQLAWNRDAAASSIATCRLEGAPDVCRVEELTAVGTGQHVSPSTSSGLFAWRDADLSSPGLYLCERDPATNACPPMLIDADPDALEYDLSDRRLVWQATQRDSDLEIFYCEFDSVRGECPAQRLTGSHASQRNPQIDGTRVVWEDRRSGAWEIYGIELPHLEPIGPRSVEAGQWLVFGVRGVDPAGGSVVLHARAFPESSDGTGLEDWGAEFITLADGRGVFSWKPDFDQVGSYFVSFSFESAGKLGSRETIAIEVLPAEPH